MTTRSTGLEGHSELARRIFRWQALRSKPGDEKAYEFAQAVQKLHTDVKQNVVDLEVGLRDLDPLMQQIIAVEGGGGLFNEARKLAQSLLAMSSQ